MAVAAAAREIVVAVTAAAAREIAAATVLIEENLSVELTETMAAEAKSH